MNIQTVKNVSDCTPLYLPHSLYLKPHARMVVSVQMPATVTGKTISNWDVMENLRTIIMPDTFSVLKATKSTMELIRFDAELDDRERLKNVVTRLDGNTIKLSSFTEHARVRATEAKDDFPRKHDWDSYFRDARNMDEKKSGERPDTIHISNLPIRWFCPRHLENEDSVKPSENIFKRIFEKFGSVRAVDIPICDAYRKHMKSHMTGMKTFSFDQELYFEGYVQFSEYMGFVRTMDALRGMKLLHKEGDKNLAIHIAVNFDTSKHMSETNIKRRQIIRDRLIVKENEQQEEERRKAEEEEMKKEKERQKLEQIKVEEYEKQRQREEKRKHKHMKKIREQEQQQLSSKIRTEEKKLLIAQRKLESIRILEALFERIKIKNETLKAKIKKELKCDSNPKEKSTSKGHNSADLRNKLITKVKTVQEQEWERQKHRVKRYKSNISKNEQNVPENRSPSVNSISSDDSVLSDISANKKGNRKRNSSGASGDERREGEENPLSLLPTMPGYPMYNPETGQFMGMYPYPAPFFPTPIYPANMPYMNNFRGGNYRGRAPRRGRGVYRGRNGPHSYDDRDSNYKRRRDYERSRSRNRSRSRSRTRSRNRSSSRSYSSRSRSRSRNRRHRRSRSKSRTKLQAEHRSRKLASTLRRSNSASSSSASSRSRTPHKSSTKDHHRSETRDTSKSKRDSLKSHNKNRRSTRSRSQTKQSTERQQNHTPDATPPAQPKRSSKSRSKSRSASIDSSKFKSPKRKEPSATPEKEWD